LALATLRGRPLLVNFWATWCPPCVEELPLLSSFFRQNSAKGWQVLGIAIDQTDAVNRFLVRSPVSFAVVMAGLAGLELSKSLGNLSGGLPFTVVLAANGEVAHRKIGRVTEADLSAWSGLS
jgi:thiol-disulfide isomerase/thioredoxin